MLAVKVGPGFCIVVGLFCVAAAGYKENRQEQSIAQWLFYSLGTGKPKTGFEKPSGIGAGVVCSFANLAANDIPDHFSPPDDVPPISKKSVTKNAPPAASSRGPCAKLAGHSEGTVWIALSEACSPAYMTSASFPLPVFIKKIFSVPSLSVVVILAVVENPDPPCLATVVLAGSRLNVLMTAESIFILIVRMSVESTQK